MNFKKGDRIFASKKIQLGHLAISRGSLGIILDITGTFNKKYKIEWQRPHVITELNGSGSIAKN